ncbi:hypothetical protein ACWGJQ_25885 [Peribacillus simplex]
MNKNNIYLRRIALKEAYNNNLITIDVYQQQIDELNNQEKELLKNEKQRAELFSETQRKLLRSL